VYTNPSIFACLEAQYGSNAVASVQTLRPSPTPPYARTPQSRFGANFFTLSNRSDIADIADIAGKRLEGVDVTGLGAGQAQWREVVSRGLSFWNLPAAMIFSHSQANITNDVFTGYADVGMVRTDLLEGLQNPSCTVSRSTPYCYAAGTFKILEPKTFPGFQFNSSTVLYPEWPVAALPHVDVATQKAVATALFALNYSRTDHASFTRLAQVATFTPPLPYSSLRDMHRLLGWIVNGSCLTSTDTYETIVCTAGTFRKSKAVVTASCAALNVSCKGGYDCVCGPCGTVPPTELSVYVAGASAACAKLAACAEVAQRAGTAVTLRDNWFGDARSALGAPLLASVDFKFHGTASGTGAPWQPATQDGAAWSLELGTPQRGFWLLEARANGVALPDSPFVVSVVAPVCAGANEAPDADGVCVCSAGAKRSGGGCDSNTLNVAAAIGGCVGGGTLFIVTVVSLVLWMRARAEAIWRIPLSAVLFADPPEILGRGTFGLVVKGTYRGTTVALKRTLPPDAVAPADVDVSMVGASAVNMPRRRSARGSVGSAKQLQQLAQFDLTIVEEEEDSVKGARNSRRASAISRSSMVAMETVEVVLAYPMTLAPADATSSPTRQDALTLAAASASGVSISLAPQTQTSSGSFGSSSGLLAFLRSRRRAAALRADFVREMRLVVHLRHPNITTVLGAVLERGTDPILVMEYMGRGSLYDLLHNETVVLDSDIVLPIISDVVSGLSFLHAASPPVLHNDLKSANILVDDSFRAKVTDFGLSGKSRSSGGQPGTPLWMAPELLRRESGPTTATDVYAFGITLSEVFSRSDPYTGLDGARVLAEVASGTLRRPDIGPAVPPMCADLMRRCWSEAPGERPSMSVVAEELKRAMAGDGAATVTSALMQARTRHTGERALLHEVFPPAVAEALAAGRRVEPQHFSCVTVFFSDIVSFTDHCARLSPEKVMDMCVPALRISRLACALTHAPYS
jgi:serine/threonine protein kinase